MADQPSVVGLHLVHDDERREPTVRLTAAGEDQAVVDRAGDLRLVGREDGSPSAVARLPLAAGGGLGPGDRSDPVHDDEAPRGSGPDKGSGRDETADPRRIGSIAEPTPARVVRFGAGSGRGTGPAAPVLDEQRDSLSGRSASKRRTPAIGRVAGASSRSRAGTAIEAGGRSRETRPSPGDPRAGAEQVRRGREPVQDVGADLRAGAEQAQPTTGQPAAKGRRDGRRVGPRPVDPDSDPVAAAKDICLTLLTARARTKHELAQALRRREVPDGVAATVLERFGEVGLIDDAAFAGQWVRSRQRGRGLARRALAFELRRKGVDDEVAGEALAEVDTEAEELRARELVVGKLRTVPADTPEQRVTAARRLVAMLARKGYPGGLAYRVVREVLAAHGGDVDELGTDPTDD